MQIFSNPIGTSAWGALKPDDATSSSATSSSTSTTSSANSATISANDFLQLLVSELKNQDPTSNTDPNEYINQLVQVNSLEQLISINQDLTPTASSINGTGSGEDIAPAADSGDGASPASGAATPATRATGSTTTGNLSAANTGNPASRIANSLENAAQTVTPSSPGGSLDSVINMMRARVQKAHTTTLNPAL
jgi:flagellar basal-body rod modification protein FlgD